MTRRQLLVQARCCSCADDDDLLISVSLPPPTPADNTNVIYSREDITFAIAPTYYIILCSVVAVLDVVSRGYILTNRRRRHRRSLFGILLYFDRRIWSLSASFACTLLLLLLYRHRRRGVQCSDVGRYTYYCELGADLYFTTSIYIRRRIYTCIEHARSARKSFQPPRHVRKSLKRRNAFPFMNKTRESRSGRELNFTP